MKRYIQIALIALVAQCGLSNVVYGMDNKDPYSLVNEIKQYSDLTDVDVNQYKLLWLRSLGTAGAFLAGAASTIGAGVKAYQQSGIVQSVTPEQVPSWMTNPVVLAGLGSLGAGYVSYRILYPRIRAGVLNKVQKFIDVCKELEEDSPYGFDHGVAKRFSVVNRKFSNFSEVKEYLPQSWSAIDNIAVYNALTNLLEQAIIAKNLLKQIGTNDFEIQEKSRLIEGYIQALSKNKDFYEPEIEQRKQKKQQKKQKAVEIAGLEADVSLKQKKAALVEQQTGLTQAIKARTYLQMASDFITRTWNGLNYIYNTKVGNVVIVGVPVYGMYWYLKNKLAGQ